MVVATAMLVMLVLIIVIVVMVVATAMLVMLVLIIVIIVMVVMVAFFFLIKRGVKFIPQCLEVVLQSVFLFHELKNLRAVQLFPGRGENVGGRVVSADFVHAFVQLFIRSAGGVAENDSACVFNLVVEKFAEVLHVHFTFVDIDNRGQRIDAGNVLQIGIMDRDGDIAELADARRLDKYTVGGVIGDNLFERLAEIADKAATDTAGVHFGDVHTGILQKSAVDADIAEFVFDKNQLFAAVGFGDKLFDQGCFSGAEKAGEYVDFCHSEKLL